MRSPEGAPPEPSLAGMSASRPASHTLPLSLGSAPLGLAGSLLLLARRGAGLAWQVGRSLLRRRAVMRLAEMDERLLKDIGITRNDIVGALEEPWHRDPSAVLMVRAIERRVASRARAFRLPTRPAATPANEDGVQGGNPAAKPARAA